MHMHDFLTGTGSVVKHQTESIDDPFHRESPLQDQLADARIVRAENLSLKGTWFGGSLERSVALRDALLPFPETKTGSNGSFTLSGLRPGKIHLLLQLDGFLAKRKTIVVEAGGTTELGPIRLEEDQ